MVKTDAIRFKLMMFLKCVGGEMVGTCKVQPKTVQYWERSPHLREMKVMSSENTGYNQCAIWKVEITELPEDTLQVAKRQKT